MVKLDERWCDCCKFQKLHMPCSHVVSACKHAHHEYKNYIYPVYTLENVFNIYRGLFGELHNEVYWPPCHDPMTRKEILMVVLSCLLSTPKWIFKNWVNQSNVLCVTS